MQKTFLNYSHGIFFQLEDDRSLICALRTYLNSIKYQLRELALDSSKYSIFIGVFFRIAVSSNQPISREDGPDCEARDGLSSICHHWYSRFRIASLNVEVASLVHLLVREEACITHGYLGALMTQPVGYREGGITEFGQQRHMTAP